MTNLGAYRKADLVALASELDVKIEPNDTVKIIIQKIENDPDFNRDIAVGQIKFIVEDRKKREEEIAKEKEDERIRKIREEEEIAKEKEDERIRKIREEEGIAKEKEREFLLEKLRIERSNDNISIASNRDDRPRVVHLKNIMQKFEEGKSDMSLFINLFERQARKAQISDDQLTTELLSLLPVNIAEMVLRLGESQIDDFIEVKKMLLERFKLSPESFRNKFIFHQKQHDTLWKDMKFELTNFLEGWIEGNEISDFEGLKELLVADQLKRRANPDMKQHFIDTWSKLIDPQIVAEKFDNYDLVRKNKTTPWEPKIQEDRKTENPRVVEKSRTEKPAHETKRNWRDHDQGERSNIFEKRKTPRCFQCNSTEHMRYSCPDLKNEEKGERVANLNISGELGPSFAPYLSRAVVNDKEMTILRDSGASVDAISGRLIKPNQLTGDFSWIKQPLDNESRRLPLANIELKIKNIGTVQTKAIVVDPHVYMDHYVLGNQSQSLIEKSIKNPQFINAVITRARTSEASKNTPPLLPPKGQKPALR